MQWNVVKQLFSTALNVLNSSPLTSGSKVLLEKLIVTQLVKNSPPFMELEGSLPCHNNPPLFPILNQTSLVHTFRPYFPRIHSNVILPSTPMSSDWSPPLRFSNRNFVCTFHLLCGLHSPLISFSFD